MAEFDTGWLTAGTGVSVDRDAKTAWNNPGNITTNDGNESTAASIGTETYSDWLRATNFGFSIPTGAEIVGIEVLIEKRTNGANDVRDSSIRLWSGTVVDGDDKATLTNWPNTLSDVIHGSSVDNWNTTLSATDINSSSFGVQISAHNDYAFFAYSAYVDVVQIKVHYNTSTFISVDTQSVLATTFVVSIVGPDVVFVDTQSVLTTVLDPVVGHPYTTTGETDWKVPQQAYNGNTGSGGEWVNPTNVLSSDSTFSSNTLTSANDYSDNLIGWDLTNRDIPSTAAVDGIEAHVTGYRTGTFGSDADGEAPWVVLYDNDLANISNFVTMSSLFTGSNATHTFGSPTDTWGTNWSATRWNDQNLEIIIQSLNDSVPVDDAVTYIDYMELKLYYTDSYVHEGDLNYIDPVMTASTTMFDATITVISPVVEVDLQTVTSTTFDVNIKADDKILIDLELVTVVVQDVTLNAVENVVIDVQPVSSIMQAVEVNAIENIVIDLQTVAANMQAVNINESTILSIDTQSVTSVVVNPQINESFIPDLLSVDVVTFDPEIDVTLHIPTIGIIVDTATFPVKINESVIPDLASVSTTMFDPTIQLGFFIDIELGSVATTAFDPTLDEIFNVDSQNISAVAFDPSINQSIIPDLMAVSVVANDAAAVDVSRIETAVVSVGVFDPSINQSIIPDLSIITSSVFAVNVKADESVNIDISTVDVVTFDANVKADDTIGVDLGQVFVVVEDVNHKADDNVVTLTSIVLTSTLDAIINEREWVLIDTAAVDTTLFDINTKADTTIILDLANVDTVTFDIEIRINQNVFVDVASVDVTILLSGLREAYTTFNVSSNLEYFVETSSNVLQLTSILEDTSTISSTINSSLIPNSVENIIVIPEGDLSTTTIPQSIENIITIQD